MRTLQDRATEFYRSTSAHNPVSRLVHGHQVQIRLCILVKHILYEYQVFLSFFQCFFSNVDVDCANRKMKALKT